MELFDCCCKDCGFAFFMEEGYDQNEDVIKCPCCGKHVNER